MEIICDTYEEFAETYPHLAREADDHFGEGEWKNGTIAIYHDVEEYTEYEITDGWYSELGLADRSRYFGAPNLTNYIDYARLGQALTESWDDSVYLMASSGEVIRVDA